MTKHIFACFILLLTPLTVTLATETKDTPLLIVWEKTLDDAVAKAKTSGKPILLDFFAPT